MSVAPSGQSAPEIVPTHVLDFIRGMAAVYVVINHTRGNFFKGGARTIAEATEPLGLYDYASIALLQATSLGIEFVILFFCVSGYAMAHSMLHTSSAPEFYKRRLIRIWPPYLVAIALAAFVCVLYTVFDPANDRSAECAEYLCTAEGLFWMATYVKVSSPMTAQFWSLPYEVIFYLLCPLLLWRRSAIPAVFAASIVLSLIGAVFWGPEMLPASSRWVNFAINAAFWFMSGVVAYHYIDRIPVLSVRPFVAVSFGLLLGILLVKTAYGGPNAISSFLMICFAVLCIRNLPHSWTSRRLLNWGFFSYSIYIYHWAIIQLVKLILDQSYGINTRDIESYWIWILALPVILLPCWALYFLGEKQCNDLLRRMSRKPRAATSW